MNTIRLSLLAAGALLAAPKGWAAPQAPSLDQGAPSVAAISAQLQEAPPPPAVPPPVTVAPPQAPPQVYSASNRWSKDDRSGFSALEQLGAQADAEDRALAKCQVAGGLNCAVTGSVVDSVDSSECAASASVIDAQPVPQARYEGTSGSSRWTGTAAFNALEQLGVQKAARNDALTKCKAQGLLDCVVVGSEITKCGGATGWDYSYACEATAAARGRR